MFARFESAYAYFDYFYDIFIIFYIDINNNNNNNFVYQNLDRYTRLNLNTRLLSTLSITKPYLMC